MPSSPPKGSNNYHCNDSSDFRGEPLLLAAALNVGVPQLVLALQLTAALNVGVPQLVLALQLAAALNVGVPQLVLALLLAAALNVGVPQLMLLEEAKPIRVVNERVWLAVRIQHPTHRVSPDRAVPQHVSGVALGLLHDDHLGVALLQFLQNNLVVHGRVDAKN